MINPLIFSPSPRNIPAVLKKWDDLEFDHLIEKYKMPLRAHQDAKKFFMNHEEYTHLVVCPDDLEVTNAGILQLMKDVELNGYPVISGMCNMDEDSLDVYNIQKMGISYADDRPPAYKDSWMKNKHLPKEPIFQVGHAGFACEMIERRVMERLSFRGAASEGQGNFDWNVSRECAQMNIPIMVDQRVNLYHRRKEQNREAKEFFAGNIHMNECSEILRKNSSL